MSPPKSPLAPRRARPATSKEIAGKQSAPQAGLHRLQNTLASLKLRLAVLAADPTCLWAQEENISVLQRIADEAMSEAHQVRELLDRPLRSGPKRPRRRG